MDHTNLKLYIFDCEACIARYYTVVAVNEAEALQSIKAYLKVRADKDVKGGDYYTEYYKWRASRTYDLPENYKIIECDVTQVLEHERI